MMLPNRQQKKRYGVNLLRRNAEALEGNDLADTRKVKDPLDQLIAENCPVTSACEVE